MRLIGLAAQGCALGHNNPQPATLTLPPVKTCIRFAVAWLSAAAAIAVTSPADAGDRLQWTGAVTQLEGAAGGGLVPWALIGGLGTNVETGGSAFVTYVSTQDFALRTAGASIGVDNRVEVSAARQRFDAASVIPGLT